MKRSLRSWIWLLVGCIVIGSPGVAPGQDPASEPGAAAQPMQEPPRAAARPGTAAAPPAELKRIDFMKGTWSSKITIYDTPEASRTATGTTRYAWGFNGMHLEGDHTYTVQGKPMKGRTTWGWDAERQQYQLLWVNSFGSSAKTYHGTFPSESALSFFTTYMMGGKAITEKVTFTFPDKNSYVFVVENDLSGSMGKVIEETGKRAAASATTKKKSTGTKSTTKTKPATAGAKTSG